MNIDEKAPLQVQKEILIHAPLERVWQVLTAIDNWPMWQKKVTSAKLMGELKKGTRFVWKADGIQITSTLQEVEKNKIIGWTGVSFGMKAIHVWELQALEGATKVCTKESLSGWLPASIKVFSKRFLEKPVKEILEDLKKYSEQIT